MRDRDSLRRTTIKERKEMIYEVDFEMPKFFISRSTLNWYLLRVKSSSVYKWNQMYIKSR